MNPHHHPNQVSVSIVFPERWESTSRHVLTLKLITFSILLLTTLCHLLNLKLKSKQAKTIVVVS